MSEPVWLKLSTLHLLHRRQVELFGGLHGIRDLGAIESALARPQNAWGYGGVDDIHALAAVYLRALAQQQGYLDGNKRAALMGTAAFLELNGYRITAAPKELYEVVMAVANNAMEEAAVASFLRDNTERIPR